LQVENSAVKEYRENIYGSETKTDDTDARLMARMGFLHEWVGEEFSIQAVRIASPDESLIRLMTRDLMKLKKEINRRKNQLHQVLAFTFPELKTFFTTDVTCPSARTLIRTYPTPQELRKASVEEIATLFRLSHDHIHEKKAGELLALAQNSVGVALLSHHIWRQAWLLEQIDMLEPAWKEPAIPGASLNPGFLGLYRLCFRKHVCHNVALIPTTALFDVGGCKGHEGAQITQTSVRQCPVKQATKRFC
jgi:Transposase